MVSPWNVGRLWVSDSTSRLAMAAPLTSGTLMPSTSEYTTSPTAKSSRWRPNGRSWVVMGADSGRFRCAPAPPRVHESNQKRGSGLVGGEPLVEDDGVVGGEAVEEAGGVGVLEQQIAVTGVQEPLRHRLVELGQQGVPEPGHVEHGARLGVQPELQP